MGQTFPNLLEIQFVFFCVSGSLPPELIYKLKNWFHLGADTRRRGRVRSDYRRINRPHISYHKGHGRYSSPVTMDAEKLPAKLRPNARDDKKIPTYRRRFKAHHSLTRETICKFNRFVKLLERSCVLWFRNKRCVPLSSTAITDSHAVCFLQNCEITPEIPDSFRVMTFNWIVFMQF